MPLKFVVTLNSSRTSYTSVGHETVYHKSIVQSFDTEDAARLAVIVLNTKAEVMRRLDKSRSPDVLLASYSYTREAV